MRVSVISLVLCACAWAATADVAHIKGAKSRLLGRLAGKHHKRGILSAVPPFKLGHDIPIVTHSFVKPLVVTYPPTASVAAVKIPVTGPHVLRYPAPVGHRVPGLPHPHYALKFPHHRFVAKPDQHFHHHHHHVAPRPPVPVLPEAPVVHAAPALPAPPPTVAVVNAAPAPPPPAPVFPPQLPVPAPPVPVIPDHLHLKPLLPAAAAPLPPSPVLPAPLFPLSQPFPYIIRPGGAVQTSFFATYPRYPFLNSYQAPLIPVAPAAPALPAPHLHPYHLVPQAAAHGVLDQHAPNVVVEQAPGHFHSTHLAPQPHVHVHPTQEAVPQPGFHLHPTQVVPQAIPLQPAQPAVPVEHDGWSPVAPAQPPDVAASHEAHYPQHAHHFAQEQGSQVYEQHTENQYHDYQQHLHHIQQQIEQAQYEQSLHDQQQQQPAAEYGVPHQLGQEYHSPEEYSQQGQDYAQHQQHFAHAQEFAQQGHDFAQHAQDFAQHAQDYAQHGQDFSQHSQGFSQHGQDFSQNGQEFSQNGQDFNQINYNVALPGQEYGVPHQGIEGRSSEETEQQYHNHIPLGLQPPIDRPLDHFH